MSEPVTIHVGDVREGLAKIPAGSVQCCVTSPPYWGLRDYGVDGQIGLEDSPDAYVAAMVEVFRGVRRALRDDGVVFLNVGDSYFGGGRGGNPAESPHRKQATNAGSLIDPPRWTQMSCGLKPKDLCMIPWRLALALQADGWWLRSVIVWAKKSPMPESVTDRPTSAWEPIFLLAKGQWSSRSIRFADLPTDRVHLGRHIGSKRPYAGPTNLCVRLASAIFDLTQSEHDFGLPAFYSEVWKQTSEGGYSDLVAGLPPQHRAAAYAARFLDGDTTAKEFLGEIHGLLRGLSNRDHLLIGGGLSERGLSPSALVNGDASITIHDTGKVSKIDFVHGQIIDTVPIGCRYFYDAEAVKEEADTRFQPRPFDPSTYNVGSGRRDGGEFSTIAQSPASGTRNQRNVWHLGPEPFSDWTESVQWLPVEAGAVGDDIRRTPSADCPIHGCLDSRPGGERGGDLSAHSPGTCVRPAPSPDPAPRTNSPTAGGADQGGSSGSPDEQSSPTAIARSTQSRRTDHAPETSPPCTTCDQTGGRTPGTSEQPGCGDSAERMHASRNAADSASNASGLDPSEQIGTSIVDMCTCQYHRRETKKTSHFATFPSEIPRRAIKAGTSEKGCCPACRAPYARVVDRKQVKRDRPNDYTKRDGADGTGNSCANSVAGVETRTIGWEPTCDCNTGDPVPCLVLDPFLGSGTTIAVARQLGRHGVGCELNPEYVELAKVRIGKAEKPHTFQDTRETDAPLFGTLREVGT